MTPFDSWYAANYECCIPTDAPQQARVAAKLSAANIWNAALLAVSQAKFKRSDVPIPPCVLPAEIREQILELRARVTP